MKVVPLQPRDAIVFLGQYEVRIKAGQHKVISWDGDYWLAYK